jgi:hypothetical protein
MPRNQFRQAVYSLAGRYDKPIPTRFLAPIDCFKIPALYTDEYLGVCIEVEYSSGGGAESDPELETGELLPAWHKGTIRPSYI